MDFKKEVPEWIGGIKNDQLTFLENVRQPGPYGRFRYAVAGCFLPHDPISSVYAHGILKRINAYDALEE